MIVGIMASVVFVLLVSVTLYRVWRIDRCPQCFWGKLNVLTATEMAEALFRGDFLTALQIFNGVHLKCGRCGNIYRRSVDGGLKRTTLPAGKEPS